MDPTKVAVIGCGRIATSQHLPAYQTADAGVCLINDFLRAVRDGEGSPVSGGEIVRIQRLMDALHASAASGQEVAVAGA